MKNNDVQILRNRIVSEDTEDQETSLGMKPRLHRYSDRSYGNSALSRELNVLTRFLRSNCGNRWDDVYSELLLKKIICSHHNPDDYIFGQVAVDPIYKDGIPFTKNGYRIYKGSYGSFYVNSDGLLTEASQPRPRYHRVDRENPNLLKIDDVTFLIRRESDGVWFRLEYRKPVTTVYRPGTDSEYEYETQPGKIYSDVIAFPSLKGLYPASLRTLSKKDKKKFNLT